VVSLLYALQPLLELHQKTLVGSSLLIYAYALSVDLLFDEQLLPVQVMTFKYLLIILLETLIYAELSSCSVVMHSFSEVHLTS